MLNANAIKALIEALRRVSDEGEADRNGDVLDVLLASYKGDRNEPAHEIAKTVCEILEPERVGELRCLACDREILDCLCRQG